MGAQVGEGSPVPCPAWQPFSQQHDNVWVPPTTPHHLLSDAPSKVSTNGPPGGRSNQRYEAGGKTQGEERLFPSHHFTLDKSLYCATYLLSDSIDGEHSEGLFVVNIKTKHQ